MTTALLPLLIHLDADLLAQVPLDPARRTTASVIPGRAIQGLLAYALRDDQQLLIDLAVQGRRVRIGPAYPESAIGQPTLPGPASWAVAHRTAFGMTTTSIADLTRPLDPDAIIEGVDPLVTIDSLWVTPVPGRLRTSIRIPTSRQSKTVADTAGPFLETVLEAHQVFRTLWRIDFDTDQQRDALLETLSTRLCLASRDHRFRLGGSATSAGGAPRFTGLDGSYELSAEHLIDPSSLYPDGWAAGTDLTVLITAPTIPPHPVPGLSALPDTLLDTLAVACGASQTATIGGSWITTTRYGGYHRLYRGFVAEAWAAAPGSTINLTATRDHTPDELGRWVAAGLGTRPSEGCGWFTLLYPAPRSLGQPAHDTTARDGHGQPVTIISPPEPVTGLTAEPGTIDPGSLAWLQDRILSQAAPDLVRNWALTWPATALHTGPSAHLWGRLVDCLSGWAVSPQASLDAVTTLLTDGLASPAKTSLAAPVAARLPCPGLPKTTTITDLITTVTAASHDPDTTLLDHLAKPMAALVLPGFVDTPITPGAPGTAIAQAWLRAHRATLLAQALMVYLRHQRRSAQTPRERT